ncbi:hypothetical protein HHI36_019278 [Cryptolaemus montrouzieri]|uniref:Zinc finger C2H2 LYAR-type domain-containing protein n=1 Tax=Cryptolaemus montrouzieri TaxID=559131 RepID=A0ABD2P2K4_9CUCU
MVVFTCNHCGDSLQKPKVEKHYNFVCKTQKSLTCVDCLKDFIGEDYNAHTKCLTEDERYAAKGTYQNGIVKKGELKQELWSDTIRSILNEKSNLKPNCRNLLNHIVNFSNVPRKKQKFLNFMKSTMGGRTDYKTIEEIWDILEEYKSRVVKTPAVVENKTNGDNQQPSVKRKNENSETPIKTKKNKIESEEIENLIEEPTLEDVSTKFEIKEEILKILNKKESISLVKLEKKICKIYSSHNEDADMEKFKKKF